MNDKAQSYTQLKIIKPYVTAGARMLRWFREKNVSPYEECSCIFNGDPSSENTLSSLNL